MKKNNIWVKLFLSCILICFILFIYCLIIEILYWSHVSIPHVVYVIRNIFSYILSAMIIIVIIGNLITKRKNKTTNKVNNEKMDLS